jgi:hypothetical protein
MKVKEMMDEGFKDHPNPRPFTVRGFKNGVLTLIEQGPGVMFVLRDDKGDFAGAMCGIIAPDLVNEETSAIEIIWRVNKLGKGNGNLLYDAFESWAKRKKVKQIVMLAMEDQNQEKVSNFYVSRGFKPYGKQYVKAV